MPIFLLSCQTSLAFLINEEEEDLLGSETFLLSSAPSCQEVQINISSPFVLNLIYRNKLKVSLPNLFFYVSHFVFEVTFKDFKSFLSCAVINVFHFCRKAVVHSCRSVS